jgi:hypothetical protein
MKKASAILLFLLAFASVGITAGTHNITRSSTGWLRIYNAGGLLLKCTGHAGRGEYFARISTPTETLGWMAGATGETLNTLDFTDWQSVGGEVGFACGSGGCFMTEMTAAPNSFVNCSYTDPT